MLLNCFSHVRLCLTLWITACQAPCPWDSVGKSPRVDPLPPGDLLNPCIKPRFPALQADSLPSEPQGKPKNSGVGSLSLLQGIFPTQELNLGLLHCRWILYQLSYQESPLLLYIKDKFLYIKEINSTYIKETNSLPLSHQEIPRIHNTSIKKIC